VLKIFVKLIFSSLGSQTHDLIAGIIQKQIEKFKISEKVVCILTDNGAKIKKALRSMQDCAQD
jgi:2-keto-3-deoxy-L-rhamnonate aldolase RhmA